MLPYVLNVQQAFMATDSTIRMQANGFLMNILKNDPYNFFQALSENFSDQSIGVN